MAIQSINPYTEKLEESFSPYSIESIDMKLSQAQESWVVWKKVSMKERADLFLRIAGDLRKNKEKYAQVITREMGKPITQSRAEVEKCAWGCEYYAESSEQFLKSEEIKTEASKSYVRFDPIGVILAIMPWNFPLWQAFRGAIPAIMAGNVVVLKHASNVPQCALLLEKIFFQNGFSQGVFTTLLIEGKDTDRLIGDKRIAGVTLTGSEPAGRKVAQTAGYNLKKVVLELGGSDPFLILDDADIEKAASIAVVSRVVNSGQTCISAKRFIVVEKVAEQFTKFFIEKMKALKIGEPMNESTQVGPLARLDLLEQLDDQVHRSIKSGATLATGGKRLDMKGFFYAPTVLTSVTKGNPAYEEEFFGPVASIIVVKNEKEAVHVANDTSFGLGANVWTKDIKKAEDIAAQLEAGCVFINGMVKSDPRLPFGGVKNSGIGRELGSYGIKEFVNIKSVVVEN